MFHHQLSCITIHLPSSSLPFLIVWSIIYHFIMTSDHLRSQKIQNPRDVTYPVTVQPREPRAWPETSSSTSKTMNSSCISGREPGQSLDQGQKGVGPKKLSLRKMSTSLCLSSSLLGPLLALASELVKFKIFKACQEIQKTHPSCTPFENLAVILDGMATEWKGFFQYSVAATCSEQRRVINNYGPWHALKRKPLSDLPHALLNACFFLYAREANGIRCVSGI